MNDYYVSNIMNNVRVIYLHFRKKEKRKMKTKSAKSLVAQTPGTF